jgi:hypothetical protein
MVYIKLYEQFTPKQIVTYKGNVAEVLSKDGNNVTIRTFKPNRTLTVSKERVTPQIKCLSQCDKRVVGEGDNRYIKCFSCEKEQRFR